MRPHALFTQLHILPTCLRYSLHLYILGKQQHLFFKKLSEVCFVFFTVNWEPEQSARKAFKGRKKVATVVQW